MSEPEISVIVVSDHEAGTDGSSEDYVRCLTALAAQDFEGTAEFIVSESEDYRDRLPPDLDKLLPRLRVSFSEWRSSFELKNEGVRRARAPLVAIVDADCAPSPGWLRAAVDALRAFPESGAVSGRTVTPGRALTERLFALAGRTVGDEGDAGETRHLSMNNVAARRDVILRHPMTLSAGSAGWGLQAGVLLNAGYRLRFDPSMLVVHASTDINDLRQSRLLMGLALIRTRELNPKHPHAWLVRWGHASIPFIVLGRSLLTARRCWARRKLHAVRAFEVPLAMLAGVVQHLLEVPGMVRAFSGKPVTSERYR